MKPETIHVKAYLNEVPEESDDENYVLNPLNVYQLLKRTANLASDILDGHEELRDILDPPDKFDFNEGAQLGILNVQHHHDLDPKDLIKGKHDQSLQEPTV